MDRRIGWSDVSYCQNIEGELECWVPGATLVVYEEGFETEQEVFISNEEIDKIIKGEVLYSTRSKASARIRELIVPYAVEKYGIAKNDIQEYSFAFGHAFQI